MKTIINVFFIILSVNAFSQKGFYLRPGIEQKNYASKGHFGELITTGAERYQVSPVNFYTDFDRFGFGLYAGYRTKKMFYEVGWMTDRVLYPVRVIATCKANDSTYFMEEISSSIQFPLNKFPIRVGAKIAGKDSVAKGRHIRWQLFVFAGIDLLRISAEAKIPRYVHDFMIAPNQWVHYEHSIKRLDAIRTYGGTFGFLLKAYNKKARNILSIGVHYMLGSRSMPLGSIVFKYDDGTSYWGGFTITRASGLYISISKDIYPKNCIKSKKLPEIF